MIDFIIYEKDARIGDKYELTILNFLGTKDDIFKIYNYSDYDNNNSRSIYILSNNDINKVLYMAKEIRDNNNWDSQIIIISNLKNIKASKIINNYLILDYIDNKDKVANRLKEDLHIAYKILSRKKTFSFLVNREIHKIPYEDILYIEKCNNQNYSKIHTKNNNYVIKKSITALEDLLDDVIFIKTHRSCIINIYNIEYYDYSKNIVYFNDEIKTDLITREKKQVLKSKIMKEKSH